MKRTLGFLILAGLAIAGAGCMGGGVDVTPNTIVALWTTTSVPAGGANFRQQDRLANPVVNEVFATFANNRHKVNNEIAPASDGTQLANDIQSFMTFPAGRSQAHIDVVKAVLVPDTMKADLSQTGTGAAYLGVETKGATGGKFGGRKLTDDVVDISLGIVFGTTLSDLGLVPDDGKAIPALTSDNVGAGGKRFSSTFPYVGAPR